jgi:multidrug efflux pump subunit AcrB
MSTKSTYQGKGFIWWFTDNSVAANVLMVIVLAAGLITLGSIRQEVFPEISTDVISISVIYPGATPSEVEESIATKIEEAIQGVDGIKQLNSTSSEGRGVVSVEVKESANLREVLDDVKTRVDAIATFPEQAERPVINEVLVRNQVMNIAIAADADEHTLRRLGERVRDELTQLPGVSQVDLVNVRPYEIGIEVSELALRRFGLSFDQVAQAIRRSSLDLPGGSIKTEGGEILLRGIGQAYTGEQFSEIVLLTRADGTRVRVGDVATVVDGFADTDQIAYFDGRPSSMVKVFRVGEEDAIDIAEQVQRYVRDARAWLPEGTSLTIWEDTSDILRERRDLLLRNGISGLSLVVLVLTLFLRLRLALWVSLGIPISFLGAIALLPSLGVTINMISLFAFIVVLGIVVDDAIVVGENIFTHYRRHGDGLRAAVEGAQEVAMPVTYGVLTTVAAFVPMLFIPGIIGKIFGVIPAVVIPVLLFSLVESKTILPAHLKHLKGEGGEWGWGRRAVAMGIGTVILLVSYRVIERATGIDLPTIVYVGIPAMLAAIVVSRYQRQIGLGLESFVAHRYAPLLGLATRYRYFTIAGGIATLMVTVALVAGGHIKIMLFPPVEADAVVARVDLPLGTPVEQTRRALAQLERAAEQLGRELDAQTPDDAPRIFRHRLTSIGYQPSLAEGGGPAGGSDGNFSGAHLGEVAIELIGSEMRSVSSEAISRRWRELTGPIAGATRVSFDASLFNAGAPIDIQLASADLDELQEMSESLKRSLAGFAGVTEISDSDEEGKQELRIRIRPEGELLGLSQLDVARQVRQAFYGEEAQRIQRGRDEIKVMVRYPQDERRSLGDFENLRVRLGDGTEIPLLRVADVELGRGFSSIRRVDRQRVINVRADIDDEVANANQILAAVTTELMPPLERDHPRVAWSFEGEQKEQRDSNQGLMRGFVLALLAIYAMMAIPFRSYVHPAVVMSAVPFGLVGAIWGHAMMGEPLSRLSFIGMVALTGVVVNDSLVMVDYINRRRREGVSMHDAIMMAGPARFRAILLTSMTTFMGLLPMLLERSLQAQFLVPLAISLAFGVVFATVVTLFIVPASYLVLEDGLGVTKRIATAAWAATHRGARREVATGLRTSASPGATSGE